MEVSLAGKHIFITAGTSALGAAFTRRVLREQARLFFTYHTNESLARELMDQGAVGFRVDLANASDIANLKAEMRKHASVLDALVHNGAAIADRTIENMDESEWDKVLAVDLKAVYLLTKELLRFLLKAERAKILTVVSRVGLQGGFGQANYAAAKGGLIALTKSLARELGKRKISVNAFNPGFLRSAMTSALPENIFEANRAASVMGEISEPEEAADFMVYLLSDRVKHASGQVFHLDSRRV
jgi:3-oxoacyl-[acyl-carrier protein] reductase